MIGKLSTKTRVNLLAHAFVIIGIFCGLSACDRSPPKPDDREEKFEGLGFVDYLTDKYSIGDIDLTLACKKPSIRVRYEELQQRTLALPAAGKNCHIEVERINVDGATYIQDDQYESSWQAGDTVVLINEQNTSYTLHLRIERQIPAAISNQDEDNRFMFRVIKVGNGDTAAHSGSGATVISDNVGLQMTSFLLVSELQRPQYIWSPAFVPTNRLQIAFHCREQARSVAGQLVCKDYTYHDLQMVVISGLVNVAEFKRRDLCFINSMKALPINNAIVEIPKNLLPTHLTLLNTVILRARYLDHATGESHNSCHLFPLAPHLSPYITSHFDTDYFYSL
ncbi:MAG: hypothetical protein OYH77_07540 [Pseudomonadota bacterium]|nr:hypothetical protein [Pseudomonadota bacterium]